MRPTLLLFLLLVPLTASTAGAQPLQQRGGELQVNTYTDGSQIAPAVGMAGDGSFVVVWNTADFVDPSNAMVTAQRFAADGTPLGDEIDVDASTDIASVDPAIGVADDGSFVIVWNTPGYLEGSRILLGELFDPAGVSIDSFTVSGSSAGFENQPVVDFAADGDFVVAWVSGDSPAFREIRARRFASDGSSVGSVLSVNTYTTSAQDRPAIVVADDGDFIVVWDSDRGGGDYRINAQRYASDGTALGGELDVNTTLGAALLPDIARAADGEFLVAWSGYLGNPNTVVIGQHLAADGTLVGDERQLSIDGAFENTEPSVAASPDGGFVVAWSKYDFMTGDQLVVARRLGGNAATIGGETTLGEATTGSQGHIDLAVDGDGALVGTWHSDAQDGDAFGIRARRFDDAFFADGFESGDVSAWQ